MDIPLRVEVRCSDEICGKSMAIIVDPATDTVTHVVVQVSGGDYLVPIDVITESAPDHIQLRWSKAELEAAEPFERLETLSADEQMMQMQAMSGSYVGWSPAACRASTCRQCRSQPRWKLSRSRKTSVHFIAARMWKPPTDESAKSMSS